MSTFRFLIVLLLVTSPAAQATLIGRLPATPGGTDYQAYYDDVSNLTWLADSDANDAMDWSSANSWANSLNVNNVTGWRLPDTLQPDPTCSSQYQGYSYDYYCTGSEMGNLYYNVLDNIGYCDALEVHCAQPGSGLVNVGPFSHVLPYWYWTATEFAPDTTSAWVFDLSIGGEEPLNKEGLLYAWAVHTGDVTSIPEPPTMLLVFIGLVWLIRRDYYVRYRLLPAA